MTQLRHDCDDLIRLFNNQFLDSFNTELVRGDDEPIYLPAAHCYPHHRIIFAHGFFASALHEVSHWCVAGSARLLLEDFGYWYVPDGRSAEQQAEFERVEVKPQAIEWILSRACGFRFRTSSDNLHGEAGDNTEFKRRVWEQVGVYLDQELSERPHRLMRALCSHYQQPLPQLGDFSLEAL